MKMKKQLTACIAVSLGLLLLTGCSRDQSPQLANVISFSLDSISEITISYDEEEVSFYESENNELTIKEYMTKDRRSYYARVTQSGGALKISEGAKPILKSGFSRYVEVYLPASYHENLTVTTTNGTIDIAGMELSLNALRVDSTSGTVLLDTAEAQTIYLSSTSGNLDVDCLNAETIKLETTSGNLTGNKLTGNVTYTTTSGNADIQSANGSGNYTVNNSGKLNVVYSEVTGNLSFYNKNDDIHVTLPADLEFAFEATTKNGSVSTNFQEYISASGRTTSGTVGEHPTVTVKMETKNGNIEAKK